MVALLVSVVSVLSRYGISDDKNKNIQASYLIFIKLSLGRKLEI